MQITIYTPRENEDYEKNKFGYAESPSYVDSNDVYQGLPLEEDWKMPVFQMPHGKFPDFLDNDCCWILCSPNLKESIDNFANNANDITWLPIEVNNGETLKMYYSLFIDHYLDQIVDLDKSKKLKNGDIYLPHFKYEKIRNFDLFVYKESPSKVFMSKKMKEKLKSEDFSGLGFEDWKAS